MVVARHGLMTGLRRSSVKVGDIVKVKSESMEGEERETDSEDGYER